MERDEIVSIFNDKFAADYDRRNEKLVALRDAQYLLIGTILSVLPADARILCVGVGTGTEISYLAAKYPGWHFTAVEPSGAMLNVCRQKMQQDGIADRCDFFEGYLESLPATHSYDAATSLLVSHFILDQTKRIVYFQSIAQRLKPEGYFINADLAGDPATPAYQSLLEVWLRLLQKVDMTPEQLQNMRDAYKKDVAFLSHIQVEQLLMEAGFQRPVLYLQTGLIHAWYAQRARGIS
jgi:tRNA (cmo5U34)-methyltransferase